MLPCRDIFAVSDSVLLHWWFTLRKRGMTVPRNSLARYNRRHLRILLFGTIYPRRCCLLQRAHELRNTGMLRLRRVARMCSSTVSDTANRLRKARKKKSSAVPHFRSGHMSVICAGLGSKGKVGVQRGRKTVGCPSFLPTAVGTASSPPRGAARSRRSGSESPAEVQRKTLRPVRANTLAQFASPAQPVQTRSRTVRPNPPAAVHMLRSTSAGKRRVPPR